MDLSRIIGTRIEGVRIRVVSFGIVSAAILTAGCVESQQRGIPLEPLYTEGVRYAGAGTFAPGTISDERWQWRITFTPNGQDAYFAVSDEFFPASRHATIMMSSRQDDGTWSTPEVAPFSGQYSDMDPFLSPDGRRLYFSSIRPLDGVDRPDLDIFYVERTARGWGAAVRLGPEVNSDLDELYPSVSAAGTLYFGVGPFGPTPDADWDIYRAERNGDGFAGRQPLAEINTDLPFDPADPTADWEFNPEISIDGRTLVFTSLRPGGYGFGDLYVSRLHRGAWSEPVNLGPAVNTENDEFHPTLSRNGRTLYFARTQFTPSFVPSDFYSVDVRELEGFRR